MTSGVSPTAHPSERRQLPAKITLAPVTRGSGQSFTDAALNATTQGGVSAVIDGELYAYTGELGSLGAALASGVASLGPVDPQLVQPIGQVISNGQIIAGQSSPGRFYVAQLVDGNGGTRFQFGLGDRASFIIRKEGEFLLVW